MTKNGMTKNPQSWGKKGVYEFLPGDIVFLPASSAYPDRRYLLILPVSVKPLFQGRYVWEGLQVETGKRKKLFFFNDILYLVLRKEPVSKLSIG